MYKYDDLYELKTWKELRKCYQQEIEMGNDVTQNTFLLKHAQSQIDILKNKNMKTGKQIEDAAALASDNWKQSQEKLNVGYVNMGPSAMAFGLGFVRGCEWMIEEGAESITTTENIINPKSEQDIINQYLYKARELHFNGKTPSYNDIKQLEDELYSFLFGDRDRAIRLKKQEDEKTVQIDEIKLKAIEFRDKFGDHSIDVVEEIIKNIDYSLDTKAKDKRLFWIDVKMFLIKENLRNEKK